ncbi:MAG: hypothetical protein KIC80_10660 [Brachyspira sp.]|nr:hypothetical protein [Brachyspira sp.]
MKLIKKSFIINKKADENIKLVDAQTKKEDIQMQNTIIASKLRRGGGLR